MKRLFYILMTIFVVVGGRLTVFGQTNNAYRQDFKNVDEVNRDFSAYYLYTMGGASEPFAVADNPDAGTSLYIKDGALHRQSISDDIDLSIGTNSYAILTLMKTYTNFSLKIDYKTGSDTYFWPVVAFRQSEAGKYFLEDGAGVFVQEQGLVTFWGGEGVSGPYESSAIAGYSADVWHTLKIVVNGVNVSVYVDNMNDVAFTRTTSPGFFKEGYISLISVNNSCSFRNLTVEPLPVIPLDNEQEQEAPLPEADTPDALGNLGTPTDVIDELSGLNKNKSDDDHVEKTGCFGLSSITFAGSIPLLVYIILRRSNKQFS